MNYLLSAFLLITTFCVFGQKQLSDISLKHTTKQDGLSMQFTVLDPEKRGVRHHDDSKVYYWHKAQKVIGTQGGSSGQLLHGTFESFYPNKQLCQKGSYHKGLKDGDWTYWRANGTLELKEHWVNGDRKGHQVEYAENGDVRKRTIIHGRKSRIETADTLIEIFGAKKSITVFDSLGQVVRVERYKDQHLHGKQLTYTDGKAGVTHYRKGELKQGRSSEKSIEKKKDKNPKAGEEGKSRKPSERIKGVFKRDKTKKEKNTSETGKPAKKKEKKQLFKRKAE